jgi:hypothetical protein
MRRRKRGSVLGHRTAIKSGKELRIKFNRVYIENCGNYQSQFGLMKRDRSFHLALASIVPGGVEDAHPRKGVHLPSHPRPLSREGPEGFEVYISEDI